MAHRLAISAVWLCGLVSAPAQAVIPGFDFTKSTASHAGGMAFDDSPGELEISQFDIRSAISRPIVPGEGMILLPVAQYRATLMDLSSTQTGFPIDDEDLHSLSLSLFFLRTSDDSPWIAGAWTRAELATDLRHISSDSFTYDLAAGIGYRFSDRFVLGVGGAALNLNGDVSVLAGIGFDWTPNECLRVGLYGLNFIAAFQASDDWRLSLRGDTAGDVWTVESNDRARALDLSSYRVGLYADRRLSDNFWLRVGGGVTIGNELELTTLSGSRIAGGDMDSGWFGEITLRLLQW